jgi:hypothetical protein
MVSLPQVDGSTGITLDILLEVELLSFPVQFLPGPKLNT